MYNKAFLIICCVSIFAISAALYAEKKNTYSVHGITFDTTIAFSSPEKTGVDAMLMIYPRKSAPGKEKMGITMVLYNRNAQKMMGMGDKGLLNYTRTVFMGSDTSGKPIERMFAGKKVKGQVLDKKIPVPSTVEVYVVTLTNGNKIGMGFNYSQEMKTEEARQVIIEIGTSMRE
jgi:hypothetical protein